MRNFLEEKMPWWRRKQIWPRGMAPGGWDCSGDEEAALAAAVVCVGVGVGEEASDAPHPSPV